MLTETIMIMALANQGFAAAMLPWLTWQRTLAVASGYARAPLRKADETSVVGADGTPLREPLTKLAA